MRHPYRLRPCTRRRLTWLVVLLITWHQLALAAYACAMPPTAAPVAMASEASMAMDESCLSMHKGTIQPPPVCQAHCQPDHATQPEARTGSVPPSVLAALPPISPSLPFTGVPTGRTPQRLHRLRAPPPPVSLLFCSLLI